MGARPDTRSGSALAILAFWCHIFFAYNSRALRDHGWLWGTSWNFPWRQASYHARLLPKSFNTAVEAWCYQEKRQWTLCPSTEDAFWCTAIWAAFAGLWRPWDWSDPWRWRTSGAERDRFGVAKGRSRERSFWVWRGTCRSIGRWMRPWRGPAWSQRGASCPKVGLHLLEPIWRVKVKLCWFDWEFVDIVAN